MKRYSRSIVLDDPQQLPDPQLPPSLDPNWAKTNERKEGKTRVVERRWRDGTVLHIDITRTSSTMTSFGARVTHAAKTIIRPCFIAYQEVLDAFEVVEDDIHSAPWEEHDGWEHTTVDLDDFFERFRHPDTVYNDVRDHFYAASGEVNGKLIELGEEDNEAGYYQYMRQSGASKQVAAEMTALWRRRNVAQLVEWYRDGYRWWGVQGALELDGKTYEESCWGFDDEDYARDEGIYDLAGSMIWDIEHDGYIVVGQPDRKEDYRENRIHRMRERMLEQNWRD